CLQLCERFREELHVLRLHSDRGGEFSSDLLRDFCRGKGILQSFTLPASPKQNGVAECCIGLVMEVARSSMIHAVAPHFLWSFAVRYAANQLNLWPRVSLSETSPTLCWTGKVGDALVVPPPGPPQVDPPPLAESVMVTVESGAAGVGAARGVTSRGAESAGAEPGGAELASAEPWVAEPGGAETEGAEPGGAKSEVAEFEEAAMAAAATTPTAATTATTTPTVATTAATKAPTPATTPTVTSATSTASTTSTTTTPAATTLASLALAAAALPTRSKSSKY
ncbi:unnamed protein product, partial [Closterium sp. NIES-54]